MPVPAKKKEDDTESHAFAGWGWRWFGAAESSSYVSSLGGECHDDFTMRCQQRGTLHAGATNLVLRIFDAD